MYPSHTNSDGIQRKHRYSIESTNPPRLHIPSTIHRPELFFNNGRPMTAYPATAQPPPPIPQRPHHSYSAPPPPRQIPPRPSPSPYLHRSNTNPPPVPPKPLSPPALPPKLPLETHPVKKQRERPHLDELQTAIEMSKLESDKQATLAATLFSQEEKELARALEESVRYNPNSYSSALSEGSPTVYSTQAGPSNGIINLTQRIESPPGSAEADEQKLSTHTPKTSSVSSIHFNEDVIKLQISQMSDDEALARQLAAEEAEEERVREEVALKASVPQPPQPRLPLYSPEDSKLEEVAPKASEPQLPQPRLPLYPSEDHRLSSQTPLKHDINDEAYARRLAAEEEDEIMAEEAAAATAAKVPVPGNEPAVPPPPTYSDVISRPLSSTSSTTTKSPSSLSDTDRTTSSNSISSYTTSPDSPPSANKMPDTPTQVPLPSVQESVRESDDEQSLPPPPMNNNPHIDQSLLSGVSIGFTTPTISPELLAMQGGMPNIISLPYGRCPPLHLQAPNWRHLLKLMAWLSETRMQATVEAIAVTKSDNLSLRTVIQFVRPHHSSADWRTVVWFTIDHPVPPSVPNARKYTNGDVDVLPWSYGLSNLPALLRDGSDTPVSKVYTVPAIDGIPYPPLPITFPNLAMYLNAVLETSRRYMNDSSSGVRKLAKMMDMCYPTAPDPSESSSSERGVGRLLKKVVGRNNRNRRSARGNDDTYELVTPFVVDQY